MGAVYRGGRLRGETRRAVFLSFSNPTEKTIDMERPVVYDIDVFIKTSFLGKRALTQVKRLRGMTDGAVSPH